jgi:hypothetical protein
MKQIELTSKLVLTLIAVILVTAIVTLPYQNQVANAAPARKYNVGVTLTGVPANAEDLEMNVTILRLPFFIAVSETQIKTVSSPTDGDTVNFDFRVPAGSNANNVFVCGTVAISPDINRCDLEPLPSRSGNSPIRVDVEFPYPT